MSQYDPRQYLTTQQQETYRACIVYAPAMGHKTAWARRLHDVVGAHLFDLQAYFINQPELAARIDRFRPADLESLLLGLDVPESIVVVDNMDFLLNTWPSRYRQEFVNLVERRLKSPGVTDKTFVFMIQDDPTITRRTVTNSRGQPRIIPLQEFQAL
jgi:hypothetical protein